MRRVEKPAIFVRVVWPREGNHADAVEAVGRALNGIVAAQEYKTKPTGHWDTTGYTAYHFTLNTTHEVEPEPSSPNSEGL